MKKILLSLTVAVAAFSVACSVERNYDGAYDASSYEVEGRFENYGDTDIRVRSGYLVGNIGSVAVNDPALINGYNDNDETSLDVLVSNSQGVAMTQLFIMGGINHEALVPGAEFSFGNSGYDTDAVETDLAIDGMACSGNGDLYDWSYDEQLKSIDVVVEDGGAPNSRRLNFTTVQSGQEAEGYVDVIVGE
ncbi:MAG: hypothetical protein GY822_16860 [Deltaproteobacteria bacterium]|nr:hypothetical protein [Deltaproteobacteria bacterium]